MTSKETFTHYQPLGNSDPAHTATAPGGLSAKAPAMTPLMLDTAIRDERESVGNPCRIFRNGCRIVRQFGGVISIIGVSFKR